MHQIGGHIQGLYETHLPVCNLERSVAFYRDRLGLELARVIQERNVAFLFVGDARTGMLGLWQAGHGPLHMTLHFAFRATEEVILDSCDRLTAEGISPQGFYGEQVSEPVVIGWMPALSIYFKDPDGHSIEMLHVMDAPADPGFGVDSYSAWKRR
ncbi:VOC family protein [Ruegeria jejuensis]|uniref:VOC family protein n=1 Tax=Ruegeria jejuensis TaxID=3233338 RepID=UPI00355B067D